MAEKHISISKLLALSKGHQDLYRSSLTEYLAERNGKNLETFTLIWYEPHMNDNREIQNKLRNSISYLKIFKNAKECEAFIEENKTEKVS